MGLEYCNRINIVRFIVASNLFLVSSVRPDGFFVYFEKLLVEDSLFKYSKRLDGAIWKWKFPEKICDRLRSRLFHFDSSELEVRDVMLVSQDHTKIRMEVLKCFYELRVEANVTLQIKFPLMYVRGVNGEVYEVSSSAKDPQRSEDPPPLIIERCVHLGKSLHLDVSDVEQYFYNNRESITHKMWGLQDPGKTCELLGPKGLKFFKMDMGRLDVVLESQNCTRIPIEVLTCHYQNEIPNRFVNYYGLYLDFAKGNGNDVYEILPSLDTRRCDGDRRFVIARRVIDDEGKIVEPLCPQ